MFIQAPGGVGQLGNVEQKQPTDEGDFMRLTRRTVLLGGLTAPLLPLWNRTSLAADENEKHPPNTDVPEGRISPITNRWGEVEPKRIRTETSRVFTGREGCAYSHHPQITSLDGVLIASWSNGYCHEDDPGQRMLMATSDDHGQTWSAPQAVVDRMPGKYADSVVTSMGIREHQGRLIGYYGVYEYKPEGLVPGTDPPERPRVGKAMWPEEEYWSFGERTEIVVSDDGGATWSKTDGGIDGFVPNLKPKRLVNGRLIISGNLMYPYTDDPAGIRGWKRVGIPGLPASYRDAPGRFQKEFKRRNIALNFCEGSCYQTDDGVVHMMLRSDSSVGLLGVTESRDNGETWSEPMLTGFKDGRNRFDFGRLPDGRFFAVSTPGKDRRPLVLSASADGITFDQHYVLGDKPKVPPRIRGHHKGGAYGYATYHILGDTVYVVYSVSKEDIEVCRFPFSELT